VPAPLNSQQAVDLLLCLTRVSLEEKEAMHKALYWVMRMVRAETCLAITLDLLQVERAMSDKFEC